MFTTATHKQHSSRGSRQLPAAAAAGELPSWHPHGGGHADVCWPQQCFLGLASSKACLPLSRCTGCLCVCVCLSLSQGVCMAGRVERVTGYSLHLVLLGFVSLRLCLVVCGQTHQGRNRYMLQASEKANTATQCCGLQTPPDPPVQRHNRHTADIYTGRSVHHCQHEAPTNTWKQIPPCL